MHPTIGERPHFVVLAPGDSRGRRIELPGNDLVVGRGDRCDLHFEDPYLSRSHARLQRHGQSLYIQDLGSAAGTFVNGAATVGSYELRHGDVVRLAGVELRFVAGPDRSAETRLGPAPVSPPVGPPVAAGRFDIGVQRDGHFNNVAGNQYQYVTQQRESFLRHVAATKTKARWLVWLGLVLMVVGFALFVPVFTDFADMFEEAWRTEQPPESLPIYGTDVLGIPAAILGLIVSTAGELMIVVGIVLHVVAASRRKKVDREFPLPY